MTNTTLLVKGGFFDSMAIDPHTISTGRLYFMSFPTQGVEEFLCSELPADEFCLVNTASKTAIKPGVFFNSGKTDLGMLKKLLNEFGLLDIVPLSSSNLVNAFKIAILKASLKSSFVFINTIGLSRDSFFDLISFLGALLKKRPEIGVVLIQNDTEKIHFPYHFIEIDLDGINEFDGWFRSLEKRGESESFP
jgi:hypothetical protein